VAVELLPWQSIERTPGRKIGFGAMLAPKSGQC